MNTGTLAVFALKSSRESAARVAAGLGDPLGTHEEREFEVSEHKARP